MKRFNCHSISNLVRYALRNKIIEAELQNLRERTRQACEQAAVEQDPEKLHELIKQINRLLEEKNARLRGNPPET
jgi:uncharacterized FlaG/YvyC family protein